jgi:hypothetical protein
MATSYTANTKLGKPAVADRNWNVPLNANIDLLDALAPIGGLCVTPAEIPSASVNVSVAPGNYRKRDGTVGSFAGTTSMALGTAAVSSIYLTDAGTLTVSTSGYPSTAHVPLATVTTGTATVSSLIDNRVVCSVAGTDALPYLPLSGGILGDGANISLGTTVGTQIGTASSQKLGFWGATPVTRGGHYTQTYTTSTHTLSAYTPIVESTPFSGISSSLGGSPYAQVSDLNNLRAAYENLRQFAENVAQVLNALIDDLQAAGLAG